MVKIFKHEWMIFIVLRFRVINKCRVLKSGQWGGPLVDTNCRSTWLGPITFLAQSTQPNPESLNLQYNLKYKTWMILTNGMIPLMPPIHATDQKHVLEFFFLFKFHFSIKKYRNNYIFLMFKTVSYTKVLNKIKIKKKIQS